MVVIIMKKIYVQKNLFIFLNINSAIWLVFSIIGGFLLDKEIFILLIFSLFLTLLSLLFLINQIHYDESTIKFKFVAKKLEKRFDDIKEIFYINNGTIGPIVVFNFEKETEGIPINYLDYVKKCKNLDCLYINGISKKDLKLILEKCKCKIIN